MLVDVAAFSNIRNRSTGLYPNVTHTSSEASSQKMQMEWQCYKQIGFKKWLNECKCRQNVNKSRYLAIALNIFYALVVFLKWPILNTYVFSSLSLFFYILANLHVLSLYLTLRVCCFYWTWSAEITRTCRCTALYTVKLGTVEPVRNNGH